MNKNINPNTITALIDALDNLIVDSYKHDYETGSYYATMANSSEISKLTSHIEAQIPSESNSNDEMMEEISDEYLKWLDDIE